MTHSRAGSIVLPYLDYKLLAAGAQGGDVSRWCKAWGSPVPRWGREMLPVECGSESTHGRDLSFHLNTVQMNKT